ncbi:Histidine kinase-, DNA gyrase B-, and HSP90-like ATPase [Ekhidna lutea]|uniref:histidine kinase n=1 Tax=Ekhidna lutea TaxID=447679 RepID=A0A239H0S1_EKHLU|nr:nitrate- and nitrite sensing domain-containing protein [Ekhidna lutea]SNS75029.1 Histidine kinase-, DNA gyrase B-, and HSP90-like ATPase [Ekhidna lutea]
MIKRLTNLPIRQKFAVIIIPLIVIILAFDYLQVRYHYLDYSDSVRLNKAITVGIEINHVVHEIQKERSISSGFLANEGDNFGIKLNRQRERTDSTLQQYYNELSSGELDELLTFHRTDLDQLNAHFDKIAALRKSIDQHRISSEESIDRFSEVNNIALNTVIKLIDETRDKEVAQQIHAIIYFLKSKEYASIERAIGTQAFSHNHIGFDLYNRFTTLVSSQNSYLDAFTIIANEESIDYYNQIVQGDEVEEVNRMREVVFANDTLSENPDDWYEASTTKINLLKRVEDYMSDNIQTKTQVIAKRSVQNFWTFLILDITIGIIAFWLMTTLVTNLLKNVKILEAYTRRISAGDMSKKVVIPTKDELGQYANTFNKMVFEIKKSHFELRKQRDKAKFLYKNIYGVSLVVFENIEQGIFLLDKEFKISKFHSKAMKEIFNNDRIAGENFSNFMRPLILPRELEALEMFMRHLFNEDMDEEVVNQLNPIDQVKIHTENNGIVATKYIRVDFTRIFRKDKIQNIMVTVSDETESILLQQHLSEAEKKKQQETERVLSILKIDPSILRGFLHNSRKMLKSISEKYEKNDKDEYSELLSFTFDIIHNLKGNAVVIGMELMANKFHEIEDGITELQSKDVRGKDFLAILYEVDEADRMIAEIAEMLYKIINIYKKFPAEGDSVSNIMVIDSLERGAELIAREVGKTVNVTFDNIENVILPEAYINPFKDMMIQLIRNSIVHGIEAPSVRMNDKKVIMGEILIELSKSDEEMFIRYKDDGRGLDMDRIKHMAVEHGIVTETQLKKMEVSQVIDLIFHEGFSTSDKSDEHAGRGQGMHLVKSIIDEYKGAYEITSTPGKSFEMTIKLPIINTKKVEE